jgi:hypothetical protein
MASAKVSPETEYTKQTDEVVAAAGEPKHMKFKNGSKFNKEKKDELAFNVDDMPIVMKYANYAYWTDSRNEDKSLKVVDVFDFQKGACQGYIGTTDEYIVLAFRGSDEAGDWLYNVQYFKAPFTPHKDKNRGCCGRLAAKMCGGCCKAKLLGEPECHVGVYRSCLSCANHLDKVLIPMLLNQNTTQKKLIICGHSLGGALATAALAYLIFEHPDLDFKNIPIKIIFGAIAPLRFGDTEFQKKDEGKHCRVEKGRQDRCYHDLARSRFLSLPASKVGWLQACNPASLHHGRKDRPEEPDG